MGGLFSDNQSARAELTLRDTVIAKVTVEGYSGYHGYGGGRSSYHGYTEDTVLTMVTKEDPVEGQWLPWLHCRTMIPCDIGFVHFFFSL